MSAAYVIVYSMCSLLTFPRSISPFYLFIFLVPCLVSRSVSSHYDDQYVSGGRFRGVLWSACGGYLGSLRRLLARWLLRYCLRSSGLVAYWDAVFNFLSVLQR